jgi:hypothetical protein
VLDSILQWDRMESVQTEQALDERILTETLEELVSAFAELRMDDREQTLETVTVEPNDRSDELLPPVTVSVVLFGIAQPGEQLFEPRSQANNDGAHLASRLSKRR